MKGEKEFRIALDPDELGRVEVKLRIDDEGAVKAEVRVERVETLQLLQRDARTLERAFEQAGLKTGGDGLQFSLQGGEREADRQARQDGQPARSGTPAADETPQHADIRQHYVRPAASGLDISI
jgi:flagellar hook-length control protein FliK